MIVIRTYHVRKEQHCSCPQSTEFEDLITTLLTSFHSGSQVVLLPGETHNTLTESDSAFKWLQFTSFDWSRYLSSSMNVHHYLLWRLCLESTSPLLHCYALILWGIHGACYSFCVQNNNWHPDWVTAALSCHHLKTNNDKAMTNASGKLCMGDGGSGGVGKEFKQR